MTAGYLCESSVFGASTYLRVCIHLVRLSLDPNEEQGRAKAEDFFENMLSCGSATNALARLVEELLKEDVSRQVEGSGAPLHLIV